MSVYGGSTYLYVDDSGDPTGHSNVAMNNVASTGTLSGLSNFTINWMPAEGSTGGVVYLDVYGSKGGSTYSIKSLGE